MEINSNLQHRSAAMQTTSDWQRKNRTDRSKDPDSWATVRKTGRQHIFLWIALNKCYWRKGLKNIKTLSTYQLAHYYTVQQFYTAMQYSQTEPFWWQQIGGCPPSHIHSQRPGDLWCPWQCRKSHELHGGAEEPMKQIHIILLIIIFKLDRSNKTDFFSVCTHIIGLSECLANHKLWNQTTQPLPAGCLVNQAYQNYPAPHLSHSTHCSWTRVHWFILTSIGNTGIMSKLKAKHQNYSAADCKELCKSQVSTFSSIKLYVYKTLFKLDYLNATTE